jgi:hypothetical protein
MRCWASSRILEIPEAGLCRRHRLSLLTIAALIPQRSTGIVVVAATVHNQRNELIMTGEQRYLLRKRIPNPKGAG